MLNEQVFEELISIVGAQRCKRSKEDLLTYCYDACIHEYLPDAVVFPKSAQEAASIMKTASTHNIFVTPRGAGSGLGGEALAKYGGIVRGCSPRRACSALHGWSIDLMRLGRNLIGQFGVVAPPQILRY